MSDEKNESAAKYFKSPKWKLLAVFLQYVLGPCLTAAITSYATYATTLKPQMQDDVNDEIDKREDAETAILRTVAAAAIAAIRTDVAPVGSRTVPARRPLLRLPPLPVVRGIPILPAKVDDLIGRMTTVPNMIVSSDDGDPQEQDQWQGDVPAELEAEWRKLRDDEPDFESLRRAAGRVQEQAQVQMQTSRY